MIDLRALSISTVQPDIEGNIVPGVTLRLKQPYNKWFDQALLPVLGQGTVICVMGVYDSHHDWGRTIFTVKNNHLVEIPLWWAALNCELLEGVTNHGVGHE